MWKRKLVNTPTFDLALNAGASLGNWFTLADGSVEVRVGKNKPKGFLYIPEPIGRSMYYDAALRPEDRSRYTLYVSGVFRVTALGRALIVDGSTFEDSHSLRSLRRDVVGQTILGVHYRRVKWGIHANWWFSTDVFQPTSKVVGDKALDFVTVTAEYRF